MKKVPTAEMKKVLPERTLHIRYQCWVEQEVDQATGSTYSLEADRATDPPIFGSLSAACIVHLYVGLVLSSEGKKTSGYFSISSLHIPTYYGKKSCQKNSKHPFPMLGRARSGSSNWIHLLTRSSLGNRST